jgi:hypothetical protein
MRKIPAPLLEEMRRSSCRMDLGWLVTRVDGQVFGFTSSDIPFVLDGVTYSPANGVSGSAVVSKNDASVDNMEVQVLENDLITEKDLRSGKWSNAEIRVFWVCPDHPEWGVIVVRGGKLGETTVKEGTWTTQLRSLAQQMQQPFGMLYQLQCGAELGDDRCGVKLDAPTWQAVHAYNLGLLSDAKIGDVVKPTVDNGFWYVANYTTATEQDVRSPTRPGQGLSALDDAGPWDKTQTAVGPAPNDLSEFQYQGQNVDIFGIKI